MKTECLPANETWHGLGGKGNDRVELIKSLIYARVWKGYWRGAQ